MDPFHIFYNIALLLLLFGYIFLNRRSFGNILNERARKKIGKFLPFSLKKTVRGFMSWVENVANRGYVSKTIKQRREARILIALAWVAFLLIVLSYLLNIGAMEKLYDIDDAEKASATTFLAGGNPYADQTIPRFKGGETIEMNRPMQMGNFNYLPLDLFAYTAFYSIFQPLTLYWFPLTNALFGFLVFLLFRVTFPDAKVRYTAFFFSFVTFLLLFDNTMFTLLLIALGFYFEIRARHQNKEFFAAFFFFLAFLTKTFPIVLLATYLLYYLQKKCSIKQFLMTAGFGAFCIFLFFLVSAPFGLQNVIRSALLFHSEPSLREASTAIGGTFLYTLLKVSGLISFYSIIFVVLLSLLMLFTLVVDRLADRIVISGSFLMFLILNNAMAPFVLPVYAAYVYFYLYEPKKPRGRAFSCNAASKRH